MFENISVKQALKLAYEKKAVIIDIRGEEEYRRGHLPMAEQVAEGHLKGWLEERRKQTEVQWSGYERTQGGTEPHKDGRQKRETELEGRRGADLQGEKIILYCAYGNQSMRLAREYGEAGYPNMASIVGGYHAYEGYVEAQKDQLWTMEWKQKNC